MEISKKLKDVVEFFKTRKITAEIGPRIKIDYDINWGYDHMPEVREVLRKEWEGLRAELDPSQIKKQKWSRFTEGEKQEALTVEIGGAIIELEGPHYRDESYIQELKIPQIPKTDEQISNEQIDDLVHRTNILWAISHCSREKYRTMINFLNATRDSLGKS